MLGIRKRAELFDKELSEDYSSNKVFRKNQICFGMGTKQIVYGVLIEDAVYCVSPAYHVYNICDIDPLIFEGILNRYNKYLSRKYMIISARQGKSIDFTGLFNETIKIPSDDFQREVNQSVSAMQNFIELQEQYFVSLKLQQKYLIENLLTGKVRIKV